MLNSKTATETDRAWPPHMSASTLKSRLSPHIWENYTILANIRNPFDRMVSSFYWLASRHNRLPETLADVRTAFAEYVMKREYGGDRALVFIDDTFAPEHVFRFEMLAYDLSNFLNSCGIDTSHSVIPVTKSTKRKRANLNVAMHYTPEVTQRILSEFAWVFERFKYPRTPEETESA